MERNRLRLASFALGGLAAFEHRRRHIAIAYVRQLRCTQMRLEPDEKHVNGCILSNNTDCLIESNP